MDTRVLSITVPRCWQDVYADIWRPQDFVRWASGLSAAALTQNGDRWIGDGPEGPISVRFTPHNAYGIMDHWVETHDAQTLYIPIRVIANGDNADVQVTLFRRPEISDQDLTADAAWVERDLHALAQLFA